MSQTSYEGPRHGDYVRYVDELLRASPLYRSAQQGWLDTAYGDFTRTDGTPGAQPRSALEHLRDRGQAAAQKARAAKERPSAKGAVRQAGRAGRAKPAEAVGPGRRWRLRIAAGHWLSILVAAVLAVVIPGIGGLILLLSIINAVRHGWHAGMKAQRKP